MSFRMTSVIMACLVAAFSLAGGCRSESTVPPNVFASLGRDLGQGNFTSRDGAGRTLTTLRRPARCIDRSPSPRRQLGLFSRGQRRKRALLTTATATNSHDGTHDALRSRPKARASGSSISGRWTGQAIEWSRGTRAKAREFFSEQRLNGHGRRNLLRASEGLGRIRRRRTTVL